MLDLAIIGSGPAALTAGLYAARAKLSVSIFERGAMGGELGRISRIENYPGFTGPGNDLAESMLAQAKKFGARVSYGECEAIEFAPDGFRLIIDGEPIEAKTVLIATGSEPRRLEFETKTPLSYCALCDAEFARGKHVIIIGGGDSAAQESLYLSPIVQDLTLVTHSKLKASPYLQSRLRALPNLTIQEALEPTPELINQFDYGFVFIGKHPSTHFLQSLHQPGLLDPEGYILTGDTVYSDQKTVDPIVKNPHESTKNLHETIIPGLFAAGDVRSGAIPQVVTAASDGAAATLEILRLFGRN